MQAAEVRESKAMATASVTDSKGPAGAACDSGTDLDPPVRPGVYAGLADALFASALQRSDDPTAARVWQAVAAALTTFGGRGCTARVAQEYGEHPETAALRMRWARDTVAGAYGALVADVGRRGFARDTAAGRPC